MRRIRLVLPAILVLAIIPAAPYAIGAPRATPRPNGVDRLSPFQGIPLSGETSARMLTPEPAPAVAKEPYVPGEIIVKFRQDRILSADSKASLHAEAGGVSSRKLGRTPGLEVVKLKAGTSVADAVAAYGAQGGIEYAEPNYRHRIATTEVAESSVQLVPDDDYYYLQWGLENTGDYGGTADADIDAPSAWNYSTGSSDVVVAVIDTGVDLDHPDLDDNLWVNTSEYGGTGGVDDDSNLYVDDVYGYDFVDDDADPSDDHGHGSHVSGTIAAEGDNGIGVAGVVWDAQIMALKAFDSDGNSDTATEIEAIAYASDKGADIINCSWGEYVYSQALSDEIAGCTALVVCAAGNGGGDQVGDNNDSVPYYPASYDVDNIVAVAATDDYDYRASFSNYGATSVDLAAPGVDIASTLPVLGAMWEDDLSTLSSWNVSNYVYKPWIRDTEYGFSYPSSLSHLSPANNENASAIAGPFDFSAGSEYYLFASYYWNLESYDYVYSEVCTDGVNWVEWVTFDDYCGDEYGVYGSIDLTAFAGSPQVWFRYRMDTNGSVQSEGFLVDDLYILTDAVPHEAGYDYMSGTSMATPHVAGAAALLKSYDPTLTSLEIKSLLLGTVDTKASLSGKCVTGGRLNVNNAVRAAGGASGNKVSRVYDRTRFSTAVAIARRGFDADENPSNGTQWVGVTDIILASGEDRAAADPLSAAGLCGMYDAPLFLTGSTMVPSEVKVAIKEIVAASSGTVTIHIVGGPVSVPDARVYEIKNYVKAGSKLVSERVLSRGSRYDLAAAIARRMRSGLGEPDVVLIANGADPAKFFDALALSPISAAKGYPILLVGADFIPGATLSALDSIDSDMDCEIIIGGGPNTVSPWIYYAFDSCVYTERWSGRTRYDTAAVIARKAIQRGWVDAGHVGVAAKLPDALTGGSMVGRRQGVLLLTATSSLPGETSSWLYSNRTLIHECFVLGGRNSVTDGVISVIKARVNY